MAKKSPFSQKELQAIDLRNSDVYGTEKLNVPVEQVEAEKQQQSFLSSLDRLADGPKEMAQKINDGMDAVKQAVERMAGGVDALQGNVNEKLDKAAENGAKVIELLTQVKDLLQTIANKMPEQVNDTGAVVA